jgi:hypothetical protein
VNFGSYIWLNREKGSFRLENRQQRLSREPLYHILMGISSILKFTMRKLAFKIFISVFLISNCSYGQIVSKLEKALESRSFSFVYNILREDSIGFSKYATNYYRELVDGYYEYHFSYGEMFNPEEFYFRLNLLSKDSIIFSYDFFVERNVAGPNQTTPTLNFTETRTLQYSDQSTLNALSSIYFKTFNSEINFKELYTPEYFGRISGPGGVQLELYSKVLKYVEKNQKDSLQTLISSTNLEKQLFGVLGFKLLIVNGGTLTSSEIEQIKAVLNKHALVYNLEGCDRSYVELSEVIEYYDLKFDF